MLRRFAPALLALALVTRPLAAQEIADSTVRSDSIRAPGRPLFVASDLAVLGAGVVASAAVMPFDERIAHWWMNPSHQASGAGRWVEQNWSDVQETSLTLGGIAVYGVARLTGMKTVADIALHGTESVVAVTLVSQVLRGVVGRARPDAVNFDDPFSFHPTQGFTNFRYRAYPSLHAASNFAMASALVAETAHRAPKAVWVVAPIAYTAAALPPTARMYLGKHWASDVVLGAVVGTWMGWKIVDYSHDHAVTPADRIFLGARDHLYVGAGAVGWRGTF